MRTILLIAAALVLWSSSCRAEEEEIRDRYLLVMQERGGLAPGTRPTCFPAWKTQMVEHYYKSCPWDEPRRARQSAPELGHHRLALVAAGGYRDSSRRTSHRAQPAGSDRKRAHGPSGLPFRRQGVRHPARRGAGGGEAAPRAAGAAGAGRSGSTSRRPPGAGATSAGPRSSLAAADEAALKTALKMAWRNVAPKSAIFRLGGTAGMA